MGGDPRRQLAVTNMRLTFEAYADGTLPEFDLFARSAQLVEFKRGDEIVAVGTAPPHLFILLSGLAKFTVEADGATRTVEVFEEGDMVGTFSTVGSTTLGKVISRGVHPRTREMIDVLRSETTHRFGVRAVEDCVTLRIDYRVVDQLAHRHVEWARMVNSLLVARLMTLYASMPDSQIGTAEGRLRRLMSRHPRLIARLSQREIANWIGVNEVSFSRIMKRLRTEEHAETARIRGGEPVPALTD